MGIPSDWPVERTFGDALAELERLEAEGMSHEDALHIVFPSALPRKRPVRAICASRTSCPAISVPGEIAVMVASESEMGYCRLECLTVVIVEEAASSNGPP